MKTAPVQWPEGARRRDSPNLYKICIPVTAVVNGGGSVVEEEVMVVRVGVGLQLVRDAPTAAADNRVAAVICTKLYTQL